MKPCPGTAEDDGVSHGVRVCPVLVLVFEVENEIFERCDVVELATDRVNRVEGQRARGCDDRTERDGSAVGGDLPLVVTDDPYLQELGHVFLQWKDLTEPPLHGEGLSRSLGGVVRTGPRSVDLPIGEQVRAGALVFGDIESPSGLKVVAQIATADIVGGTRGVSSGGNHDSVNDLEVSAWLVPSEADGLNPEVGEARTAARCAEIGEVRVGDVCDEGAGRRRWIQKHATDRASE